MLFQELNRGKCKTYLVACETTRKALLIDPVKEHVDRYLAVLAYRQLTIDAVLDTHTHADHPTACFLLNDLTGVRVIMDRFAPTPRVTEHVHDGDTIEVGRLELQVLFTPGHSPDSISLYLGDRVFTGDVLMIRGTGRADFPGGDAGQQYDSITRKLFALPDDTMVFPAHDYRGNTQSTIGEEKRLNPRIAGRTREQYIALMNSIAFPLPDKIQEVLQPNQTAIDDDITQFPNLMQLNRVSEFSAAEVCAQLEAADHPLLLDVREPAEYTGELGHIVGSVLIPLKELAGRVNELEAHKARTVICICRAGVRSTTAAAILTGLGFERVSNLKGGMLAWKDKGYSVDSMA